MRVNTRNDVLRATGNEATVTTVPTNGAMIENKKFSLSNTTDKMGITTAGAVTKGFWWGMVFTSFAFLAVGMYFKKVNLSYVK